MLQHLYLRVTVILMFIFRSNTRRWEFTVLLLVFFKITAFTWTCIFMQSREKPNSFKWANAKCSQHQMFDVQQINTKMNQQYHSLKSSSLCASTKARTRIPISANRLTSITGRKKKCVIRFTKHILTVCTHTVTETYKRTKNWTLFQPVGQSVSSPRGRRGASFWSRLFKQSPVQRLIAASASQLRVSIWQRTEERDVSLSD